MVSANERAVALARKLESDPERYRIRALRTGGAHVLDVGIEARGGWEAARIVTAILVGGLGNMSIETYPQPIGGIWRSGVHITSDHVILEQAGCYTHGWQVRWGTGSPIVCGPGRTLGREEGDWLSPYTDYADRFPAGVITLQQSESVGVDEVELLAKKTRLDPEDLYIIASSSGSIVCSVQVAGRILEETIHRLAEEGFPLESINTAEGICPIPPVIENDLVASGRIDDSLNYGGQATFDVSCDDADIERVIGRLCANARPERERGRSFLDIYHDYDYDFNKIPMEAHSPAVVVMQNRRTGSTYTAGELRLDILAASYARTEADPL